MKLKHLLIPYAVIVVVLPALIAYRPIPLGMGVPAWEILMDILMGACAVIGFIAVLISRKKEFGGWLPLALLAVLVILPQGWLWLNGDRSFQTLRIIYRFAFLYITLFIVPMELHFSRKEICILIGAHCVFGLFCCLYELHAHPDILRIFFEGKPNEIRSFCGQRNRFGAYTALWLILCLFAMQLSEKRLWLIPAAFFGFFLLMTKSRGALLLAGVFILACLISYRRQMGTGNLLLVLMDIGIVLGLIMMFEPSRNFFLSIIDVDRGVTGRDKIWEVSWNYFRESNVLLGHGFGTQIERVMIERLGANVSTHNVYLYILNLGGISLLLFYVSSFVLLLRTHCHRHHYTVPLVLAVAAYGFFELACAPFDYWNLSNMFTVCLFFIPSVSVILRPRNYIPIH